MPLTRDDIVRAAQDLIDEAGLDALTLRAVAERVGVRAPTLYWHVKDKRHLLDLVAEYAGRSFPEAEWDEPADVDELLHGIRARLWAYRRGLLEHRDAVRVMAGNRPTQDSLPRLERSLATLNRAGLEPGEALRVLTALGSFLIGDVLETQAGAERGDLPELRQAVLSGDFPTLARAGRDFPGDEERFALGLELMLEGLRLRLGSGGALPNATGAAVHISSHVSGDA